MTTYMINKKYAPKKSIRTNGDKSCIVIDPPPKPEPKPLKCGDRVEWVDGSFTLQLDSSGISDTVHPAASGMKKYGVIVALDCVLPTPIDDEYYFERYGANDAIVCCDCGTIVLCNSKYLKVL